MRYTSQMSGFLATVNVSNCLICSLYDSIENWFHGLEKEGGRDREWGEGVGGQGVGGSNCFA